MAQPRTLVHAPIVEALVDFRALLPETTTVERIEQALQDRDFGYRKVAPILRGSFGFVINPQVTPQAQPLLNSTSIIGVRLHSVDEKYVAQFTTEGFSLSRLEPYESWEALVAEAERIWRE